MPGSPEVPVPGRGPSVQSYGCRGASRRWGLRLCQQRLARSENPEYGTILLVIAEASCFLASDAQTDLDVPMN